MFKTLNENVECKFVLYFLFSNLNAHKQEQLGGYILRIYIKGKFNTCDFKVSFAIVCKYGPTRVIVFRVFTIKHLQMAENAYLFRPIRK